ncbi:MAG: hypothetical protein K0V04_37310 [Deltaproteobacteria bacterium]|nr:hypothetical protein [Deltaproteobacteria bacterium]
MPGRGFAAPAEPATSPSSNARATPSETTSNAREPATAGTPAPVRVLVDPSIDDAALLPQWVTERNTGAAAAIDLPDHEQWIVVEIQGATYQYQVTATPMRDGERVGPAVEQVACECNSNELLELVDRQISSAVAVFRANPVVVEEEPVIEPPPPKEYRPFTVLGIGGMAAAGLGVGGVVAGATMIGIGDRSPSDAAHLDRQLRSPGTGVLVTGGVLLLAGVAVLVTDIVQCKQEHPRCIRESSDSGMQDALSWRRPRLEVSPWVSGRGAGIRGRF